MAFNYYFFLFLACVNELAATGFIVALELLLLSNLLALLVTLLEVCSLNFLISCPPLLDLSGKYLKKHNVSATVVFVGFYDTRILYRLSSYFPNMVQI